MNRASHPLRKNGRQRPWEGADCTGGKLNISGKSADNGVREMQEKGPNFVDRNDLPIQLVD